MNKITLDHYTQTGFALTLLAQSPYHKQQQLDNYFWVEVLPALWHNQVRFYVTDEGHPTAMVTWAWLNEAVEQDLHLTGRALFKDEWQSGNRLFFNDWITPYDNIREVLKDMTHCVFPDQTATSLRRNQDGTVRKINRWTGINMRQLAKEINA